jgi:O-antigen ligase
VNIDDATISRTLGATSLDDAVKQHNQASHVFASENAALRAFEGIMRSSAGTLKRERKLDRDLPRSMRLAVETFLIFAVLVLAGINVLPNVDQSNELTVDPFAPIFHAILLVGAVIFSLPRLVRVINDLTRAYPFLLLMAFFGLSTMWSPEPLRVVRATISMGNLVLLAVMASSMIGTLAICRIQVKAMVIAALASLIVAKFNPQSGYDIGLNEGAIRGIFSQKNQLGDMMVIGLIALSYVVLSAKRLSLWMIASALLAMTTILLARSITSLGLGGAVIGATIAALLWIRRSRWTLPMVAMCGAFVLAVAITYWAAPAAILDLVGKDPTLTGRAGIWRIIHKTVGDITLLGAGYSTFWSEKSLDAQQIWQQIGFVTQNAHNGYLEILLELGWIGLALFAFVLLLTFAKILTASVAGARVRPAWLLIVITVIIVFNLDEAVWPRADLHMFQWVLAYIGCRHSPPIFRRRAGRGILASDVDLSRPEITGAIHRLAATPK